MCRIRFIQDDEGVFLLRELEVRCSKSCIAHTFAHTSGDIVAVCEDFVSDSDWIEFGRPLGNVYVGPFEDQVTFFLCDAAITGSLLTSVYSL